MKFALAGARVLLASHSGRLCSAGTLLIRAAEVLCSEGADVSVTFPREEPRAEVVNRYADRSVRVVRASATLSDFDLVLVNCQALAGYLANLSATKRVLFWIHEAWRHRDMDVMRAAIARCNGLILQSPFQLHHVYPIEFARATCDIFYLPNFAAEHQHVHWCRSAFAAGTLVVAVGDMSARKRVQDLVEAVAPLPDDLSVMLVGNDAKLDDRVRSLILNMPTRFHLAGALDNRATQMRIRAADIFVHPSAAESQSLAVMEAMMHGRCIIASELPAHRYMGLTHEVNCLTYPVGDTVALHYLLRRAIQNPLLREELGSAAQTTYRARFGPDKFRFGLIKTIQHALGSPGRSR